MKKVHIHLVSDATGETLNAVSRACLSQFSSIKPIEHMWNMVRTKRQLDEFIIGVEKNPGMVLFTLVNKKHRTQLQNVCTRLDVPCIPVLTPVITAMSDHFSLEIRGEPGLQHVMDADYFNRVDAMNYVMSHDDGQSVAEIENADVVLVGVSRTSKTPTCLYLANRGVRAANLPIVPGTPLPEELLKAKKPLIVGITKKPERLVQLRRNRLNVLNQDTETDYADFEVVRKEVTKARQIFTKYKWPVIDATRKSIEEIAANIIQLHTRYRERNF